MDQRLENSACKIKQELDDLGREQKQGLEDIKHSMIQDFRRVCGGDSTCFASFSSQRLFLEQTVVVSTPDASWKATADKYSLQGVFLNYERQVICS